MAAVNRVILGIDSATRFLALALWSAERGLISEFTDDLDREHARRIVPEIRRLLTRAGFAPQDIGAIGVGVGPGSYVGVRVGIATAAGLARAWDVPLAGAGTLPALALRGLAPGQRGVAVLDARRGNVYAAGFGRSADPRELRLAHFGGPEKLPRTALAERFGADAEHLIENLPPDAAFTAAATGEGVPATAMYL